MGYYNRNGEKLEIKKENLFYLGSGYQAKVYRHETRIVKKYYPNTDSGRIPLSIFDRLREIHNPHLMQLEDVFFESSFQEERDPRFFDGYIAKYYEDHSINVLLAPTDYLLDNFRELDRLMECFASNGIRVRDLSRFNTILGSDTIILIDPDEFGEGSNKVSNAYTNKRLLLGLLRSLCRSSLLPNLGIRFGTLSNLIDFEVHYDTDIAHQLTKRIGAYKRPIDYFMRK